MAMAIAIAIAIAIAAKLCRIEELHGLAELRLAALSSAQLEAN